MIYTSHFVWNTGEVGGRGTAFGKGRYCGLADWNRGNRCWQIRGIDWSKWEASLLVVTLLFAHARSGRASPPWACVIGTLPRPSEWECICWCYGRGVPDALYVWLVRSACGASRYFVSVSERPSSSLLCLCVSLVNSSRYVFFLHWLFSRRLDKPVRLLCSKTVSETERNFLQVNAWG